MKKVIVYSTPLCPHCTMAKNFLKENNIPFEDKDVSSDQNLRDGLVKRSGQMKLPVIEIDGKMLSGYNRKELKAALDMKD